MEYSEFTALPQYEPIVIDGRGMPAPSISGAPRWGGENQPPAIGTEINVTMNGLGLATVTGYFVDCGFLGLLVRFHNPPAWYTKQNRGNPPGHVFGIEFKAV